MYNLENKNWTLRVQCRKNFVVVDDVLTQVIWNQYLMKEQECEIHDNIIYQDNQSTVKLENNGIQSSSKRKRHINIRYYLITDRIMDLEASVEFCPTLDMIGDYLTKAMQGSKFRRFSNIILGIHEDDIPSYNMSGIELIEEKKINYIDR